MFDIVEKYQKSLEDLVDIKNRRELAFDFIMQNCRGKFTMSDGRSVLISRMTADKYTNKAYDIKLKIVPNLIKFLHTCKFINIVSVIHDEFAKFAYYDVYFYVDEKRYKATINIGIRTNGESILYDINPIQLQ